MLKKIFLCLPVVVLGLCAYGFFLNIGNWLTPAEVPGHAQVVICLAEDNYRMDKAISLLREGLVEKVVVTTEATYQGMLSKKVDPAKILKTHRSAESTYEEALLTKGLLDGKLTSAMVVTDPFHLYRAKWTFLHVFSNELTVFSFVSSDSPLLQGFWWANPLSRLFVLSELPKILYYWTWHGLFGIAKNPTWVLELEQVYIAFIKRAFIGTDMSRHKSATLQESGTRVRNPEYRSRYMESGIFLLLPNPRPNSGFQDTGIPPADAENIRYNRYL